MKIQINTDHNIKGHEAMILKAESFIENHISYLSQHITRIEVHLSDENGKKIGGNDKRCLIEARLEKHQPIVVTEESGTLDEALQGATEKLKHALDHLLGRLSTHR